MAEAGAEPGDAGPGQPRPWGQHRPAGQGHDLDGDGGHLQRVLRKIWLYNDDTSGVFWKLNAFDFNRE